MTDSIPKSPRKKKADNRVENGIYQCVGANLFDVRVRKRINGEQHQRVKKSVKFLGEARKTRDGFIAELSHLEDEIKNGNLTWADAKKEYFTAKKIEVDKKLISPKTISVAMYNLEAHTKSWDNKRISDFKREFIVNDLTQKLNNQTKSTVVNIIKAIRGLFDFFLHKENSPLKYNPCKGIVPWGKGEVKKNSELDSMTREEVEKLLNDVQKDNFDWYVLFFVAYNTGLRSGELWSLKWENIDAKFETIEVNSSYCFSSRKEKSPKNGKSRLVPINEDLRNLLLTIKVKSDSSYVLPRIQMWKEQRASTVLRSYQRKLKIKETNFHSLRSSFITHLLLSNISHVLVMEIVGHSQYATTQRYIRSVQRSKELPMAVNSLMFSKSQNKTIPFKVRKKA